MASIKSAHWEMESIYPPLNLGWSHALLWPIEYRGSGNVPVPGLVFSKPRSVQDTFSGEASCHPIKKTMIDYWLMRYHVERERTERSMEAPHIWMNSWTFQPSPVPVNVAKGWPTVTPVVKQDSWNMPKFLTHRIMKNSKSLFKVTKIWG